MNIHIRIRSLSKIDHADSIHCLQFTRFRVFKSIEKYRPVFQAPDLHLSPSNNSVLAFCHPDGTSGKNRISRRRYLNNSSAATNAGDVGGACVALIRLTSFRGLPWGQNFRGQQTAMVFLIGAERRLQKRPVSNISSTVEPRGMIQR